MNKTLSHFVHCTCNHLFKSLHISQEKWSQELCGKREEILSNIITALAAHNEVLIRKQQDVKNVYACTNMDTDQSVTVADYQIVNKYQTDSSGNAAIPPILES